MVITTGGTAGSRRQPGGVTASVPGSELVNGVTAPHGCRIEVLEAMTVNSFALSLSDLDNIHAEIRRVLNRPDVRGVVVVHGTDTLEETAMLVALSHNDPRPVVFTGAQRAYDNSESDGRRNVQDALTAAAAPELCGQGVVVCFAGRLDHAIGTRKIHSTALDAFADLDRPPLGRVDGTHVSLDPEWQFDSHRTVLSAMPVAGTRVGIVPVYPGADRVGIDAEITAGAAGIVLEATGCGNANSELVEAVAELKRASIPVLVSTRVPAGSTEAIYGDGGGADLVRAGAVMARCLRPGQARIFLLALLVHDVALSDTALQNLIRAPNRVTTPNGQLSN